jgi:hypothetical protein
MRIHGNLVPNVLTHDSQRELAKNIMIVELISFLSR